MSSVSIPQEMRDLFGVIRMHGGNPMLVGGCVVDMLRERAPEDWDVEVYGIDVETLERALEPLEPNPVGKAFGILKLSRAKMDGLDVDVSIPRTDNSVGAGHKDFKVQLNPKMKPKAAALRRDYTINTIYYDPVAEKIHDPYGGLADLNDGILRVTDPDTFGEDPLRVMRGMQLLARKLSTVDPKTIEICRKLMPRHGDLPKPRLFEEWRKLLMLSDFPTLGLEFLRQTWWLHHYPELKDLQQCPQNPEWHPEGDVWVHTMYVVDAAARVRSRIPEDWRLAFMFGCLLHDIGKPSTTDIHNNFSAHAHSPVGAEMARGFMERLTDNVDLIEQVVAIVKAHLDPPNNIRGKAKPSAWRRLHNRVRLDVLGWVTACDWAGRGGRDPLTAKEDHEASIKCWEVLEGLGDLDPDNTIPATLMGRHLIEAGYKPGPTFSPMLAAAYDAQMEDPDLTVEELLVVASAAP